MTKCKKKIWIEIISNYPITGFSSFWEKEFFFDLRDNKFNSLLKKNKSDNVIVIGIVVVKGLFFLKQISDSTSIKPQQDVKNFGKKKSTRIFFSNKNLELNELNKLNIILESKQLI